MDEPKTQWRSEISIDDDQFMLSILTGGEVYQIDPILEVTTCQSLIAQLPEGQRDTEWQMVVHGHFNTVLKNLHAERFRVRSAESNGPIPSAPRLSVGSALQVYDTCFAAFSELQKKTSLFQGLPSGFPESTPAP